MRTRSLIAAVILSIPLLFVIVWHLCDRNVPTGDAADYADASIRITRQVLQQHGPIQVVVALWETRGWRASLFSALAVPGLLLTNQDILAGTAATLIITFLALTLYLFRLLLLWSEDPLVAAAGTAAILSMPTFLTYSLVFMSEAVWVLFLVAFVFHLVRDGPFKSKTHSAIAGVFGGLMICVRPVESVMVLGVLLPFMFADAVRSKTLKIGPSLIGTVILAVPATLLFLSTWMAEIGRFHIWGACLVAVVLALRFSGHTRAFATFMCSLIVIVCGWWGGFMPMLRIWSEVALDSSTTNRFTTMGSLVEIGHALLNQFRDYGELQLTVLGGLAVFVLWTGIFKNRRAAPFFSQTPFRSAKVVLYAAPILLTAFAATYSLFGSDRRRGLAALMLLAAPVVTIAGSRSKIALGAILALFAVQCTTLAAAIAGTQPPTGLLGNTAGMPALASVDQNWEVAHILERYVTTGSNVAVFTMALFGGPRVYEPNALRLICLAENLGFNANNVDPRGGYDRVLERMRKENWNYILLDSLADVPPLGVREPHVHFTQELQHRLQVGDIPGLRIIGHFQMGDREHTILYVLPESAPASIQNNVSSNWYGAEVIATSHERAFLPANLNDGTALPWGSTGGSSDLYAGVVLPEPHVVREVQLRLFSPDGRPHIHDIRMVTADEGADGPKWKFLRARLKGDRSFGPIVTVPPLPDDSVVTIEIDESDPVWRARTIWGFACLRSQGDTPNYFGGSAVYLREFEAIEKR